MNALEFLDLMDSLLKYHQYGQQTVLAMNNTKDNSGMLVKIGDDVFSVTVKSSKIWPIVKHAPKLIGDRDDPTG